MAYTEHDLNKMQKIADLAVGLVEQDMTLAKIITHEGVEKFKGAQGDKLVFRVPGRLPAHDYAWRNNRSNDIPIDIYHEGTTDITFGGRAVSAVEVTDEQMEFDLDGWAKLLTAQTRAVGQKLHSAAAKTITDAPYVVTVGLGGNDAELRRGILALRAYLNKMRVPAESRYLVIGTDVETAILMDDKMTLASNTSEARAENALANASIGRIYGFNVIVDLTIPADEAYAFVASGFVLYTAAPAIPQSVGVGATASYDGFSLRWLRDYDMKKTVDRSLVDAWYGANQVKDLFLPEQVTGEFDPETLNTYFVRGAKLTMSGVSKVPAATGSVGTNVSIIAPDMIAETGAFTKFTPAVVPAP